MAHVDPHELGMQATQLVAMLAIIRPDLLLKHSREQVRRMAVESLLAARREAQAPAESPVESASR